jgi:membrane-anchored glycerophosphoryl diester phosphodiesterase (GDPDase)
MSDTQMDTNVQPGRSLFLAAAWTGALAFFILPVAALLLGKNPLLAALLGYVSIAVFTGGIAARYDVVTARSPILQLFSNLMLATGVALIFFFIFLLLYHL